MNVKMVVGLAGAAFSGKDTFAQVAKDHERTFGLCIESYAFALPLKKAAMVLFGFTPDQVFTPEGKEAVDAVWGKTPRYFLQDLGTEVCRDRYDPNFWIRRAEKELSTVVADMLIITDVRFENEANWVRSLPNGVVVHVERPDAPAIREHRSEVLLAHQPADMRIVNVELDDYKMSVLKCIRVLTGL